MAIPEKIKSFFKPNTVKIIISFIIIVYAFFIFAARYSPSPLPEILLVTPFMFGIFALILYIPYSYILACLIAALFGSIKKKKWLLILVIIIFILLIGIDEPLVNNTINRPDYSCSVDSDCVAKSISKYYLCPDSQCVNQNWNYYHSMINRVLASKCRARSYSCLCVENKCVTQVSYA